MRKLTIAYAGSCRAKFWKNKTTTWPGLCEKLQTTHRTGETVSEYKAMSRADKEKIKDHGGFVGGYLNDGRRLISNVKCRSFLSLDGDNAKPGFIERFEAGCEYAAVLYTTHGHTPEAPRVRIVIPFTEDISPDCYVAVARYFAAEWGIDQFDPCSYKVNQLMYWPTTPSDGEYICRVIDGPFMDAMEFLEKYPDWRDCSKLPVSKKEKAVRATEGKKQEDPLTKTGTVGAFCRTYTIQDAISKFLPDVYAESVVEGRYDYIPGEGSAGVVVYDDKFAYSHHATDPAGGRLLNAFDLVRLHRFGEDDDKTSFIKMSGLAESDELVRETIEREKLAQAQEEFKEISSSWDEPIPFEGEQLPVFPIDALPLVIKNYAVEVAGSTQTPVDMAAVACLTAVSACMRNLYKVEGKLDWLEPTNLYSVIIAEPSERKSSVIRFATKPIDDFVKEYNKSHGVEIELSRAQKQRLENKKNSLVSQRKSKQEKEAAEDFDDTLRNVIEQLVNFHEIKPMRVYVDDVTPEKLTEALAENDGAMSIISSEGGIFDVLSGTYSNKVNIDVFLKAYSGENISVDRIMRQSISVENACLTILLSAQPVVISELMSNKKFRHRGLTARFLYSVPKSFVGSRSLNCDTVSESAAANYKALIYSLLQEIRGAEAEIIHLTDGAKQLLNAFYDWVEKRLAGEFSMYSDWLGKLVGNTLRIAGVLAKCVIIKGDDAILGFDDPVLIDDKILSNAIKIARYFLVHAVSAYGSMGIRSDFKSLTMVIKKIKDHKSETITRRGIMRLCRWLNSAEEAQSVLNTLEDYGYVRMCSVDISDKLRTGRPKNAVYSVNPVIYK